MFHAIVFTFVTQKTQKKKRQQTDVNVKDIAGYEYQFSLGVNCHVSQVFLEKLS